MPQNTEKNTHTPHTSMSQNNEKTHTPHTKNTHTPHTLHLPILHISMNNSPDHPSTPPLQSPASIPFKWEEQPGKPRPYPNTSNRPEPAKALDLPPMLSKTPSPTTVLDGPYNVGRPKFSSFRLFIINGQDSFPSFRRDSPEGSLLGGKKRNGGLRSKGLFGKMKSGNKEKEVIDEGSLGISYSSCSSSISGRESEERWMRRNGSFSNVSHGGKSSSHLWATIYGGLKQVMQWKSSKKSNKQGQDY